tara:strand:+ start:2912 stop:4027 length:1116 start_codon:yes stop_codon:yes gene_type:complete
MKVMSDRPNAEVRQTALYSRHLALGARIVDFSGWDMPVHYGSQIDEHHQVRRHWGVFDVSHMTVVDIEGRSATDFLRMLLCNDVANLARSRAQYTAMLNPDGGIVDDLIVYRRDDGYRLIVNAGTRDKDLAWLQAYADEGAHGHVVDVSERPLAILAVQGPDSLAKMPELLSAMGLTPSTLRPFTMAEQGEVMMARTGYTGEQGLEIILPQDQALPLWDALVEAGCAPVGLGARDTLRLEAGMNLYGQDMDETITPAEANMSFVVNLKDEHREFIGRKVLETQTVDREMIGVIMTDKGVLRAHQVVQAGNRVVGEICSGAYSPSLEHSIGFARVSKEREGALKVQIRNREIPLKQVHLPFVRNGRQAYSEI